MTESDKNATTYQMVESGDRIFKLKKRIRKLKRNIKKAEKELKKEAENMKMIMWQRYQHGFAEEIIVGRIPGPDGGIGVEYIHAKSGEVKFE